MAKWGEGDPRWIVEERPDATNVNNWHWTEKNACQWSKDRLTSLFDNIEINESVVAVTIKNMKKCEGEATANNRKAKLIFFYEWVIELEFEGRCAGSDQLVKGVVEIPNLSDENDIDEVTIDVTLTDPTSGSVPEKIKALMRSKGTEIIRSKLQEYVTCLKSDFSQGLILPTKDGNTNSTETKSKTTLNKTSTFHVPKPDPEKPEKLQGGGKCLEMSEEFKCTAADLYRAFTNTDMVKAFTQSKTEIEPVVGGKIAMLDSTITGKFIKLNEPDYLEFEWRCKSWPRLHSSNVVIKLEQTSDSTKLSMVQQGVPDNELERTREGWQRCYFDAMKRTFGFGASLGGF